MGKNIWIYKGYTIEEVINKFKELNENLLPYVDVIVDGPFIMEKKDLLLNFRGSSNQRLIDVQKYLKGDKDFLYEKE